jgi:hypothetical protein
VLTLPGACPGFSHTQGQTLATPPKNRHLSTLGGPAGAASGLAPKQAAFVREYLVDLNATQAAIRAGYELQEAPLGFYVYVLFDSRSGRIFYVGKGKGERRFAHVREARGSCVGRNARKLRLILEIQEAGGEVECPIFSSGLNEREALALERALIAAIGKKNLTNHSSGIVSSAERFRLLQRKLRPLEEWMRIPVEPYGLWSNDTERAEFYRQIERHIQRGVEA